MSELDSVSNDKILNGVLRQSAADLLGASAVHSIPRASMGSEDFSVYLQEVPGAMFRLGTASDGRRAPLHSSNFDITEEVIIVAAKIIARSAVLWSDPNRAGDRSSATAEITS